MIARHRWRPPPEEVLQIVLDDTTVARLRRAADSRGLEVEQLIVHVIDLASRRLDALLAMSMGRELLNDATDGGARNSRKVDTD